MPIRFYLLYPLSVAAALLTADAGAAQPVASYSTLPDEEWTEISVLGTPHLYAIDGFEPDHLSGVRNRLEGWAPDAIVIERMPFDEIAALRERDVYAPILEQFVTDATTSAPIAQEMTGLSAAQAYASIGEWDSSRAIGPEEAFDRMLTGLAAYEPETALIYWRQLGPDARTRLADATLRETLETLDSSANERVTLAADLAIRLGHPRLWSMDSQADKDIFLAVRPELEAGLADFDITATPWFRAQQAEQARAVETGDFLPLYRHINAREDQAASLGAQFDVINTLAFENRAGRRRSAAWDIRNFRIAANIRRASAATPGGRVLVLIGAGHKPFLDEILAATLDVRVVQPSAYLGEAEGE